MSMSSFQLITAALFLAVVFGGANAQLSATFYDTTCPNMSAVVRGVMERAEASDVRIGAKLIRMHFHDCISNGCDGSVLLDNADGIESEKESISNLSLEGFDVVDNIKTALENVCPGVVSCTDILTIASQIGVSLAGLSTPWEVQLGRRDSRTANRARADSDIPSPFDNFSELNRKFTDKGLDATDLVALSGAHTIGRARCLTFQFRVDDNNSSLDPTYRETLRQQCPGGTGNDNTLVDLDPTTPDGFDNNYFTNLQTNRGLLETDQMLFSTPGADTIGPVDRFAGSQTEFFNSFGRSMITLANLGVLTGNTGEIRLDCKRVN